MRTRLCVTALAVLALVVANSLRAADEKAALKCPVSGQPAKADKTADFNGGKVQFCCDKCPTAFNANSAKFAAKANLQLAQSGQLKQVKCPLTGRPMAADKSVEVAGVKVSLCCGGCLAKASDLLGEKLFFQLYDDDLIDADDPITNLLSYQITSMDLAAGTVTLGRAQQMSSITLQFTKQ